MTVAHEASIRSAAIAAHGETWRLLELPNRTPAEDAAMIAAARLSLQGWLQVGTAVNEQRGVWLLARAYVALGQERPALEYALGARALTEAHRVEMQDFDLAFAEEIVARAFALSGNFSRTAKHYQRARELGHAIKDEEDRKVFFSQFDSEPWFGFPT